MYFSPIVDFHLAGFFALIFTIFLIRYLIPYLFSFTSYHSIPEMFRIENGLIPFSIRYLTLRVNKGSKAMLIAYRLFTIRLSRCIYDTIFLYRLGYGLMDQIHGNNRYLIVAIVTVIFFLIFIV
jgi:hypothetical protein